MLLIYLGMSSVKSLPGQDDLLVEERLEDDNLVAGLNEPHEGTQHALHCQQDLRSYGPNHRTLICTGGDRDLGIGVDGFAEERRVGVRNGLLETGTTLYHSEPGVEYAQAVRVSLYTFVGEYWLHSTRSRACFAASMANWGGL